MCKLRRFFAPVSVCASCVFVYLCICPYPCFINHAHKACVTMCMHACKHRPVVARLDSLWRSSVRFGTIQGTSAWPLRKDDAHKSRSEHRPVVARPRKRRESQIDYFFRKFEYRKAVDHMHGVSATRAVSQVCHAFGTLASITAPRMAADVETDVTHALAHAACHVSLGARMCVSRAVGSGVHGAALDAALHGLRGRLSPPPSRRENGNGGWARGEPKSSPWGRSIWS